MVSFWPWRGDDSSPASFEKALSNISAKIQKASIKLDSLRQRSRRFSVLWTLYAGFAYLFCTIILLLVVGWRDWGPGEYAAVIGGPVSIYIVRLALATYYEYRTSSVQTHVDELTKQRDATFEKLKTATRYDSTQELLKKYGGSPTPKAKPTDTPNRKPTPKQGAAKEMRTSFVPPPTANIPQRDRPSPQSTSPQTSTPQAGKQRTPASQSGVSRSPQTPAPPYDVSAEFAPNAFSAPPQYAQVNEGSRWYDRIMDVLLGEDETRPGARMALICNQCRLVNGQAPPGMKRLEDLGKWRCGECGATNGEESEVARIVSSLTGTTEDNASQKGRRRRKNASESPELDVDHTSISALEGHESDATQYSTEESETEEAGARKAVTEIAKASELPSAEPDTTKRRSTRSTKGKKAR